MTSIIVIPSGAVPVKVAGCKDMSHVTVGTIH